MGRDHELAVVHAFAAGDRLDPYPALLLVGDPGIGRTALLEAAREAATAAGVSVLQAAGVQFEGDLSHAGLNQLLLPLQDHIRALTAGHRDALAVALGLAAGPAVDPLVLGTACLTLLQHAGADGRLLLLVDDVQWLDRASVRLLGFLARRMPGTRIRLLAAVRSGAGTLLQEAGVPERQVGPLDPASAEAVLRSRWPGQATGVRQRVLEGARGNPLALVELPAALTPDQRSARVALPPVLPLGGRLQRLFADRVARLPAAARWALLLIALDGSGDPSVLATALAEGTQDALAAAEDADLLRWETTTGCLVLAHPLIAAALVGAAGAGERRRAQRVLADALHDQPDRRAWHLGEAATGPDETAAALLEGAGRRASRQGDPVRAVATLLRSAELSPAGGDRARRLAAAALLGADAAGELREVPGLLARARQADPEGRAALPAAVAAGYHLLHGDGDIATAHAVLAGAIGGLLPATRAGAATDGGALDDALHGLMLACAVSGRAEPWAPFEAVLPGLADRITPVLAVSARTYATPALATGQDIRRLDQLIATAERQLDPTRVVRIGIAACHLDRLGGCRTALRRVADDSRPGGAIGSAVKALHLLALDALHAGSWDDAEQLARRGLALGRQHGYELVTRRAVYCLAVLSAARGDVDDALRYARELTSWAAPRGVGLVEHYACRVRGLVAAAAGRFDDACAQFSAISPPGRLDPHAPIALYVALDLVEAALAAGHRDAAAAHSAALQQLPITPLCPRLALTAAATAALLADDPDSPALFERALAEPGAGLFLFDHARVQLAYGERLRRLRAIAAAREQLSLAQQTFEVLRATPWAVRADRELRATGITRTRSESSAELTFMEREIAELAASGLPNKEIASRLRLSHRTVGAHLYRIYPKLGVASRAALRDALTPDDGPITPSPA